MIDHRERTTGRLQLTPTDETLVDAREICKPSPT
jgi:hypothetical protein